MDKISERRKFAKGAFALAIAVVITKILGVFFKVPLSYILNDEGMGYFNSAYSIYSFFYILCTAGVPKAMTLIISECNTLNDRDSVSDVLRIGVKLFGMIGFFATLLNIISAPVIVKAIGNDKALATVLSISPSVFFVALSGVYRGYLNSIGKLTSIALSQFFEAVLKLGIGLGLAFVGMHLSLPIHLISAISVLGITIGSIISCIYLGLVSKSTLFDNNFRQINKMDFKSYTRKMLKTALPISLSSSVLSFTAIIDMALIVRGMMGKGYTSSEANALYGNYTTLAVPMINLVISVITPIALSYVPKLSSAYLKKRDKEFTESAENLFLISDLISVFSAMGFYFYSFEILDLLFSVNSAAIGAELLTFLSLGVVLLSSLTVVNTLLEACGKLKFTMISLLVGSVTKIVIAYFLIKTELGILGAPIGTVASYFISLVFSVTFLGITKYRFYVFERMLVKILIGFISFVIPFMLFYISANPENSFLNLLLCGFVSSVFYLIFNVVAIFISKKRKFMSKMHKKDAT